ncbi:MAG: hypothetical protein H0X17_06640 [Deltaproteobacteria bacterium]|nr:hypothetical protein [Deltaproteobacteria bacterium]
MIRAALDGRLGVEIRSTRELVYSDVVDAADDRPLHVRAGSGIAVRGDELLLVQDDASFIARVRGAEVTSIPLPFGANQRRRFEVALGNKYDKLDLETCVVVGDELWAFGSGSLPVREVIVRLRGDVVTIVDGGALHAALRDAVGSLGNVEGVAIVGAELWLCHRGNTGPSDRGPAIARCSLATVQAWLDGGAPPPIHALDRYDLGAVRGVRLGFTDACAVGDHVFYVAAAEASDDAIEDGVVVAAQLGVIAEGTVRASPLTAGGHPIKAEGLAMVDVDRAWITVDPDDPEAPTQLLEAVLTGPWRAPKSS